jgi:flagellar export protein FliJ
VKKFIWRLQRLLDIKIKQEGAKRGELVAVTEQAVAVRSQIMVQRVALRKMLAELSQKKAKQRLSEQEFFLKYAHVSDKAIKRLEEELAELEKVRQAKIKEIMKIRRYRKGLEKLRAEARAEFQKEEQRYEQKESDAKTTVSFARKIIQRA